MTKNDAKLINATGSELSHDMACASTIEPFHLGEEAEDLFYDEACDLPVQVRVEKIKDYLKNKTDKIRGVIVEDNELGRHLFKALFGSTQLVSSVKRPGSNLHWYWQPLESYPEP